MIKITFKIGSCNEEEPSITPIMTGDKVVGAKLIMSAAAASMLVEMMETITSVELGMHQAYKNIMKDLESSKIETKPNG